MDQRQNDPAFARDERNRGRDPRDRNQRGRDGGSTYGASGYGPSAGESGGFGRRERQGSGGYGTAYGRPGDLARWSEREQWGDERWAPKGYQRSDVRLREDICERLMYAFHIDSSEVTVAVVDGKVTLEGTVPERRMKHEIEDLVDECPGVQDIDNRVRVQSQREDLPTEGGTTTASTRSMTGGASSGRKL